jgi:hypothetical protein
MVAWLFVEECSVVVIVANQRATCVPLAPRVLRRRDMKNRPPAKRDEVVINQSSAQVLSLSYMRPPAGRLSMKSTFAVLSPMPELRLAVGKPFAFSELPRHG